MNTAIEVAMEEFRATQFAFRERSAEADEARNRMRETENAQTKALMLMQDAQAALLNAIADNP